MNFTFIRDHHGAGADQIRKDLTQTAGELLFDILISPLWQRDKARR